MEEPNAHLFLKTSGHSEKIIGLPVPDVNEDLCNCCGECAKICQFSAIVTFGTTPLCLSGNVPRLRRCARVCPTKAISENQRHGVIETSRTNHITSGHRKTGCRRSIAQPLIRAVKNTPPADTPVILDAPPGTSCPVIAAIRDSDFVLLVTEPTPFGLHDLTLAVDMVRELNLPFGVLINRMGSGDDRVHTFCKKEHIPVLMEIPDDRQIAENYSRGILMVDALLPLPGAF